MGVFRQERPDYTGGLIINQSELAQGPSGVPESSVHPQLDLISNLHQFLAGYCMVNDPQEPLGSTKTGSMDGQCESF